MSIIVQSGSKQYLVNVGDSFVVDRITNTKEGEFIDLPILFNYGETNPENIKLLVVGHVRGKKIRVVKFKSKSNYHRQYGYRASQTILKVVSNLVNEDSSVSETQKSIPSSDDLIVENKPKSNLKKETPTKKVSKKTFN